MKNGIIIALLSIIIFTGAGCANQQENNQPTPVDNTQEEQMRNEKTDKVAPGTEKKVGGSDERNTDDQNTDTEQISEETMVYKGSWFDIEYPANFTAEPSLETDEHGNVQVTQTNEAEFTSPDGTVAFFVYSPLWSGEPEVYLDIAPTEELVDESEEVITEKENQNQYGDRVIRRTTVKAKDGSYHRSFVSIKEQVGTESEVHHVFGIRYEDDAVYEMYRDAYIDFKNSLQRYAD